MTIESDGAAGTLCDRPLAAPGLTSYRYKGQFGWVMIGAKDHTDALREADRSVGRLGATLENLQVWDQNKYVPAVDANVQ